MDSGYCLVDIPTTLTPGSFVSLRPLSTKAPAHPRNPPEPKKEGAKWPQADDLQKIDELYRNNVESALKALNGMGITQWSTERIEREDDAGEGGDADFRKWNETFQIMKSFKDEDEVAAVQQLRQTNDDNCFRLEELYGRIISNPHDQMKQLVILVEPAQSFYIPAHSSFVMDTFPSASPTLSAYTLNTSPFDLVILDPPWHNKAVTRMKRKRDLSYTTGRNMASQLPPVGNWLGPGGIVGIWCTNNLKTMNQIKTEVFKKWRVELVAEWIWLKVTASGEPVGDLNSAFRKPYEILLIGRKQSHELAPEIPTRKVIVGVPAFHSQKPCLKGLFDAILPAGYRACELYARNLVEGWMSVGDECLKFMRDDYWRDTKEPQVIPSVDGKDHNSS